MGSQPVFNERKEDEPMETVVQTMKAIQGETFDSISLHLWGDEKYTGQLLAANPETCHLMRFFGGEVLNIPQFEEPEGSTLPPWKQQKTGGENT
jgi:hypothetical protein